MDYGYGIDNIENWIEENDLARLLLKESKIDKGVFKALLLYYWSEDIKFEDLGRELDLKKPGAWKRWRKGLDTIIKSFYTIELAIYSGILDIEIAELLTEDLRDYIKIMKEEGDIGKIRDRLEKRMIKLKRREI